MATLGFHQKVSHFPILNMFEILIILLTIIVWHKIYLLNKVRFHDLVSDKILVGSFLLHLDFKSLSNFSLWHLDICELSLSEQELRY